MHKYLTIFFWGFAISFLGTLPIGTLNITVANYAIQQQYYQAFKFGIAAVGVEVIIVKLITLALLKLSSFQPFIKFFKAISIIILLGFAFISLHAAWQQNKFTVTVGILDKKPFLYGIILSLINPLHIPFWMGWTTILQTKKILQPSTIAYNIYVAAIGIGTLFAFLLYSIISSQLVVFLNNYQFVLNWIVGLSLLSIAVWQSIKLFSSKTKTLVTL